MNILAVDTTRKSAKIFAVGDKLNIVNELKEDEKQSEFLMTRLDECLSNNSLKLTDFDSFGVVVGPGSFTGIRVGIATIKAFAYALNKSIVSLSVFDIVKDYIKNGVFISECTSSSVYYAEISDSKVVNVGVEENDNISKFKAPLFILKEEHNLNKLAYKFNVLDNYDNLCCQKFLEMANSKTFATPEPYYIQLSQAERNLEGK